MPTYTFAVFEVDSSYYYDDAQSLILGKDTLEITDSADDDLHRTVAEDPANDQTFSFAGESAVTDYTVEYLDYAQVNASGVEFELYAMEVFFADGSTKYYVMSKDDGFDPEIGDDLTVTTFSTFTTTTYGEIGAAICFAAGTRILTDKGCVPVETIRAGVRVQTMDNGLKEVLWTGAKHLLARDLCAAPHLAPVLVRAGALGNNANLIVSPQHRLLLRSPQIIDGQWSESLIKAKHLAMVRSDLAWALRSARQVTYHHILLDMHEVIFANGAASESFLPGPMALKGISRADRRHLRRLFSDKTHQKSAWPPQSFSLARPSVKRHMLHQFVPKSRVA